MFSEGIKKFQMHEVSQRYIPFKCFEQIWKIKIKFSCMRFPEFLKRNYLGLIWSWNNESEVMIVFFIWYSSLHKILHHLLLWCDVCIFFIKQVFFQKESHKVQSNFFLSNLSDILALNLNRSGKNSATEWFKNCLKSFHENKCGPTPSKVKL